MYLAIVICNVFNWAKMNSTAAISGKKQTKKRKTKNDWLNRNVKNTNLSFVYSYTTSFLLSIDLFIIQKITQTLVSLAAN